MKKIKLEDIKDGIFTTFLCSIVIIIGLFIMFVLLGFLMTISKATDKMLPPRTVERVEKLVQLLSPEQKEQYDKWYKKR